MSASKLFAGLALASLVCSTATAQVQSSFGSQDPSESVAMEPESTRSRLDELEAHAAENDSKIKSLEASAAAAKSKLPSVQLGGVFQADGVAFEQDQASRATYGRIESGADFRRARLGAKGSITDSMDYFMQMDFAFFGRPTFTDLWVDFKEADPLGTV